MEDYKKNFSKIYDKLAIKIYRFVLLKVNSAEIAEDLTSQVFTKTWNKIRLADEKDEIRNMPAYIYKIARAEIANFHRSRSKYKIVSAENTDLADNQISLEQAHQIQSDIDVLKASLNNLEEDYQNVIIWRYIDGLPYSKISEIMDKPEGTIRVMVHRALKELKDKMESV